MEMINRSFSERGSSLNQGNKLGRSNSSLLASELVSSDISRFAGFERLSESMRLITEPSSNSFGRRRQQRRRNRAWGFITNVFSFSEIGRNNDFVGRREESAEKKVKVPQVVAVAEKKKERSSWIPDPHRRWPVQGW